MVADFLQALNLGVVSRDQLPFFVCCALGAFCAGLPVRWPTLIQGFSQVRIISIAILTHVIWNSFVVFSLALCVYDEPNTMTGLVLVATSPVCMLAPTIAAIARARTTTVIAAVLLYAMLDGLFANLDLKVWAYLLTENADRIHTISAEMRSPASMALIFVALPAALGALVGAYLPGLAVVGDRGAMVALAASYFAVLAGPGFAWWWNNLGGTTLLVFMGYFLTMSGIYAVTLIFGFTGSAQRTIILLVAITAVPLGAMMANDNMLMTDEVLRPLLWWHAIQIPMVAALAIGFRRQALTSNGVPKAAITP